MVDRMRDEKVGVFVRQAWEELLANERGEYRHGLPTGFADVDELMGGLRPGRLVLLAGQPGLGTTAFLLNVVRNLALYMGARVGVLTCKLPPLRLTQFILCSAARLEFQRMHAGFLSRDEKRAFLEACELLEAAALTLVDVGSGFDDVERHAKRLVEREDAELVVLCGLGEKLALLEEAAMAQVAERLRWLARELKVPILLELPLRPLGDREDTRPRLGDLWGGGRLPLIADMSLLLHRPEYYAPDLEELRGRAELIVASNLDGPVGSVDLRYDRRQLRFESTLWSGV